MYRPPTHHAWLLLMGWVAACASSPSATSTPADCDEGSEQRRVRFAESAVNGNAPCTSETQRRTCRSGAWSVWSGTYAHATCATTSNEPAAVESTPPEDAGDTCSGPRPTRVRFAQAEVADGERCESEMQQAQCVDGLWEGWSGLYEHETCTVRDPLPCGDTPHGGSESRERFPVSRVAFGAECMPEAQSRACDNGLWQPWSGAAREVDCEVAPPAPCGDTPHGDSESRERFFASEVRFDENCIAESQTRVCDNGAWQPWSGSAGEASCVVWPPADCGDTPHGGSESRERFEHAQVAYGASCVAEAQTRTCHDGTWSSWSGDARELSCVSGPPASCDATQHGGIEQRERYPVAQVPFGESCVAEAQTRVCENGTWSAWSGDARELDCEPAAPADCGDAPHGTRQARDRYPAAQVPFGESCVAERQTRTCHDGTWLPWSGDARELTCEVRDPAPCGEAPHGTTETRERYAQAEVPFGEQCVAEAQSRTCHDGTWSAWTGSAEATSCSTATPMPCGTEAHGTVQQRTRYASAEDPWNAETPCEPEVQQRSCVNGTWEDWSGTASEPTCTVCTDVDGDGHGAGCLAGPDCDDYRAQCFEGCGEFSPDRDEDGRVDASYVASFCERLDGWQDAALDPDCDDHDASHWADCDVCVDQDGDDYGDQCDLGDDCDDTRLDVHPGVSDVEWDYTDADCDGLLGRRMVVETVLSEGWYGNSSFEFGDGYLYEAGQARSLDNLETVAAEHEWHGTLRNRVVVSRGDEGIVISTLDSPLSEATHRATVLAEGSIALSPDGRFLHLTSSPSWTTEVRSYDLSNPDNPVWRGTLEINDTSCGARTDDGLLVLVCRGSDSWLARIHTVDAYGRVSTTSRSVHRLVELGRKHVLEDGWLVWREDDGLYAVDLSDPLDPGDVVQVAEGVVPDTGWDVDGGFVYYTHANAPAGDGPWQPELCRTAPPFDARDCIPFPGPGLRLDVHGEMLLHTLGAAQMSYSIPDLFDEGLPALPHSTRRGFSNLTDVAARDGYAFATDPGTGLVVFDLTAPQTPVAVLPLPGGASEVELYEDHAYLVGAHLTAIIDIATPSAPTPLRLWHSAEPWYRPSVPAQYMAIAEGPSGPLLVESAWDTLRVVDPQQTPMTLQELTLDDGRYFQNLESHGPWVYALVDGASDADGLAVVSLEDGAPQLERVLGAYTDMYAGDAFLAEPSGPVWNPDGFGVLQHNPTTGALIAEFPGGPGHVARLDELLFTATRYWSTWGNPPMLRVTSDDRSLRVELDDRGNWDQLQGAGGWLLGHSRSRLDLMRVVTD